MAMTKDLLIEKLFSSKSIFGNRICLTAPWYRINRKGKLERFEMDYWSETTWKNLYEDLILIKEMHDQKLQDNEISKLNWSKLWPSS